MIISLTIANILWKQILKALTMTEIRNYNSNKIIT